MRIDVGSARGIAFENGLGIRQTSIGDVNTLGIYECAM